MKGLRSFLLVLLIGLTACTVFSPAPANHTPAPSATLAPPSVKVTSAPDVRGAVEAFLKAWQSEDYEAMYALLAPATQDAVPQENFIKRYKDVAVNLTLQKLDYEILSTLTNVSSAQAAYRVTFHTAVLGNLTREMSMNLELRSDGWRVLWEDGMIMPELRGGNLLALEYRSPSRGSIFDRNGYPLAINTDAVALGIVPGEIPEGMEGAVLAELSRLTGYPPEWIKALYGENYPSYYIPVGETTRDAFNLRYNVVKDMPGFAWKEYSARYYSDNGIAPHVTGYTLFIPQEKLEEYMRQGYEMNARIGWAGLEKWGEATLSGQRGVGLYVLDPQGRVITRLGMREALPARSIYTTLDANLQREAQKAINSFNGAVVVLERDTGRVLAMASSPGFDPNLFEPSNINSRALQDVLSNPGNPLVNRAAQSAYPPGSVFKIVTMAAALETGLFKPEDTYECGYYFTDLPGYTLTDWTLEKELPPSGTLTLPQGLMRSCNPWFYHIGLELSRAGLADKLAEMARAFGLGVPTGIQQIAEETGNIPDPASDEIAVQMAIGQSQILVTPLQIASMIAAVGNGGTLYRPQVVEKIVDPDGNAEFTFKPEERGKLPVSQETLTLLQDTLRQVVVNSRGTAVRAFSGLGIPVSGKTGTAQTGPGLKPHAWFAAYTSANRENKPDIAVVVIAENAGEGSEIAAPIARRVIEVYFLGQPQRIYPWEAKLNVTRTPTPEVTETPSP
ncbi:MULTISPECIES: penicillin-binding transpeptidase domain-containing protein [Anaerolinea]|uniref:penicillin-binding transpeptidase domain-containing protein n=1 Tax=Anaerolinea TaxID=233189 RepID=UPI0026335F94|nr:penicillin-binding transpeptidase domain-containing protein [Anaerolinea thermophila]